MKITLATIALALALALAFASCNGPNAPQAIIIDGAWVRTPAPGSAMSAAYMVVKNNTAEAIILVAATSDSHADVSIHESRLVDGIWSMTAMPSVPIAAGEQINLQPGGLHLMMTAANKVIKRGDKTVIRLQFADGQQAVTEAPVQDSAP